MPYKAGLCARLHKQRRNRLIDAVRSLFAWVVVILSLGCRVANATAETQRVLVLGSPPAAMIGDGRMTVEYRLETIEAFIATLDMSAMPQLTQQSGVHGVAVDRGGHAALARSLPQLRADRVQRRDDLGAGVTVAVVDDGIEANHPDLAGRIDGEECFCAPHCCPNGEDRQSGPGAAQPQTDHGTHVAGIIASAGHVAPVGVAPQARVLALKVLDATGRGFFSDWLRALDWIAAHRPDVRVVNMSLESDITYAGDCAGGANPDFFNLALGQIIQMLRARGTLTFAASGNAGDTQELSSPGCIGSAVAVGALRRDNVPAAYSNSGIGLDLLAPGGNPGTGGAILSAGLHGSTSELYGTSMAAAHASGTAALLLSIAPSLGADELEMILSRSGRAVLDERNDLTRPRLDALAAYQEALDQTRPLTGGGSRATDCLLEWEFSREGGVRRRPDPGIDCRDNDPTCDGDQIAGQCSIGVTPRTLQSDRRLPRCGTDTQLGSLTFTRVSRATAEPVTLVSPVIVPAGTTVWLRGRAVALDGRADSDRLRLRCIP